MGTASHRLLVLADIPRFGFRVSSCLSAAGHVTHVMGTHYWSLCRVSRRCAGFTPVRREDLLTLSPRLAHQIGAFCRRNRIDAIVPADLESTLFISEHRTRLADVALFPHVAPDLLMRLHDKWSFYHLLDELDIPQPRTFLLERPEHVDDLNLTFPVVVKPRDQAGHVGVWSAASPMELRRDLEYGQPRLVQELVPGPTATLEILASRGQVVSWTLHHRDPAGEPVIFLADAIPFRMSQRIVAHTNFSGVANFDLVRDERNGRWLMIECNPRFASTLLYSQWAGVNFAALGVSVAMQEPVERLSKPASGECINVGIGPRAWLRALLRGRVTPRADMTPMTRAAWRFNLGDPIPVLLQRLTRQPFAGPPVVAPARDLAAERAQAGTRALANTAHVRGA